MDKIENPHCQSVQLFPEEEGNCKTRGGRSRRQRDDREYEEIIGIFKIIVTFYILQ